MDVGIQSGILNLYTEAGLQRDILDGLITGLNVIDTCKDERKTSFRQVM